MKIRIDEIKHMDRNKDGIPYVTQKGEKYTRCVIKSDNKTYGAMNFSDWLTNVKAGDEIEAEIVSREYNGKTYYDLKKSTKTPQIEGLVLKLQEDVENLKARVGKLELPNPTPDEW